MKFIIRDDDLNHFSKSSDISRWYSDIFVQDIPVSFSCIPFINPVGDMYPAHMPQEYKEFSIIDNPELFDYIKGNTLIEILQHGTTHANKKEKGQMRFEYAGTVPKEEAKRGREELERAFGAPVSIFVPPHDWIDTAGVLSVENAGMNIIRGRGAGFRNWIFRPAYVAVFIRMLWFKCVYIFSRKQGLLKTPAYPHVLNFGRHKEMCSYRLEDPDVFAGLEYAHRTQGIFVVVTHLHFYDAEKKARLLQLTVRARELGAEFVRPSTIFI